MNIAILGAGIAGLACAHELERYDVKPVIFEDLDFIGDREAHVTAILQMADRPIRDSLAFFKQTLHLDIKPLNTIRKLTHFAPSTHSVIKGSNLGYFFKRSKERDSVKGQLLDALRQTTVILGQKPGYKELIERYDYVVIANGRHEITRELGCWNEVISGWLKGADVEGEFDPHELMMWINRRCLKNGYAYLCPYDSNKAALAAFVPFSTQDQIDYYWNQFLSVEKIKFKVLNEYKVQHIAGFADPHHFGKVYFAGNAGGAIDSFLGFGQLNSASMGVLAARSIIEGYDYEKLIKDVIQKNRSLYEFRKFFDTLYNRHFDFLIKLIALPGIRHIGYFSPLNIIKLGGKLLKFTNKLQGSND